MKLPATVVERGSTCGGGQRQIFGDGGRLSFQNDAISFKFVKEESCV